MNKFEGIGTVSFDAKQGKGKSYYAFFTISMQEENDYNGKVFYNTVSCNYFSKSPVPELKKGAKVSVKGKIRSSKNSKLKIYNPEQNKQYDLYETKVFVEELKVSDSYNEEPNGNVSLPQDESDDEIPF